MPERRRDTLPKNRRPSNVGRSVATGQARRISRKEREALQRRRLYWGMGVAGALIIVILALFSANDYWFKPRHVLATVNGTDIRRKDYWKVRSFDLINQINTYSSYAQNPALSQQQQQQYASFAQSAAGELNKVWDSTSLNDSTLSTMVEDQIYLQNVSKLGVTVTDQEVNDYITQLFQPPNAPLITSTPTATLIPERAAWATQTARAAAGTPIGAAASPIAGSGTPVSSAATPIAGASMPVPGAASPVAPGATPAASPQAAGSQTATASAATPNPEQAQATVTATYKSFKNVTLKTAHMSDSDFKRLIVRPAVAREKVTAAIDAQVGQSAEQIHAAHILVGTKDLADTVYKQVTQPGANFEQIAKDQSEDATTAPNGGDLGWIAKGEMIPAFESVAFATAPGQISQPFQTRYGWHIVKVYQKVPNRAMTAAQLAEVQKQTLDAWVASNRSAMKITSEAVPTPTPAVETFAPPAGAPPTPAATVQPAASPGASPVASPAGSPVATPIS